MGVIDGFSAARMLEIERASIVGGLIDTYGRLILSRQDGTTLDAGRVVDVGTPDPTASTIAARDANGNASFADPVNNTHADTKGARDVAIAAEATARDTAIEAEATARSTAITNLSNAVDNHEWNASKITTGILATERIPSLNASKITSGVLAAARIPALDASKITTGVLAAARIPALDASKITTGVLADGQLPERLRGPAAEISVSDINLVTDTGWYRGYNLTNAPLEGPTWFYYEVIKHDAAYIIQIAYLYTNGDQWIYVRQRADGTWGPWYKQASKDYVDGFFAWAGASLPVFHAWKSGSFNSSGAQHDILMDCDLVRVNQGNHYNTTTKKFTAPVAGLYEFEVSICNTADTYGPEGGLYKNGVGYCYMSIAYNLYTPATQTMKMMLAAGDVIHAVIRNNGGYTIAVDGTRSYFAGKLLSLT